MDHCQKKYLRALASYGYPPTNDDLSAFNTAFNVANNFYGEFLLQWNDFSRWFIRAIKENEMPSWVTESADLATMFNFVVADYKKKYLENNQQPGEQQRAKKRKQSDDHVIPLKVPVHLSTSRNYEEEMKKMQLEMEKKEAEMEKTIAQLKKTICSRDKTISCKARGIRRLEEAMREGHQREEQYRKDLNWKDRLLKEARGQQMVVKEEPGLVEEMVEELEEMKEQLSEMEKTIAEKTAIIAQLEEKSAKESSLLEEQKTALVELEKKIRQRDRTINYKERQIETFIDQHETIRQLRQRPYP